jgi:hypothetical protein
VSAWTARTLGPLPAIACLLAPGAARADGGEQALSAELGWATFSAAGKKVGTMEPPALSPDYGGSLGFVYERGVSSDISLRGEAAGAMFSGGNTPKQTSTSYAGLIDAGAVFRFDVLKYVPYAFGGVGVVMSGGGPIDHGSEFVLALGGGLDVLASRSRSWGVEGRLASFGGNVTLLTIGVRGTIRWGYF